MHVDFAVLTGTHHTASALACQDYCLAKASAEGAWAVVADGCSTGALSDLGARAWALAARQCMRGPAGDGVGVAQLQGRLLEAAEPALRQLDFDDGFSTLALLQADADQVCAVFFGDGALLTRHLDGSTTLVNVQYTANAPYYLNYQRRPDVRDEWLRAYPGQELLVVTNSYDAAGELTALKTQALPAAAGPWQWLGQVQRDELEMVLLSTDGVSSRSAGFVTTARQILGVRSAAGEFLRRRLGKLARQWSADGTLPSDDLAVAGVWLRTGESHG